ncbi:MAG: HAMP domain-containing protein [Clostridia bacterium]|nr:HAMP domain-containing protein [Clostridia bacterium]
MKALQPAQWARRLFQVVTPNSLFKRLLIPYLLTGILVGASTVYNILSINIIVDRLNATYESNAAIFDLVVSLGEVQTYTESYLSTKSSTALENYYRASGSLNERAALLNAMVFDTQPMLLERNIRRMIESYTVETQSAIQAKRGRDIASYTEHYDKSTQIYEYIILYADQLNKNRFESNYSQYRVMGHLLDLIQLLDILILALILGINFVIVLLTALRITRPVAQLAQRAGLVAEGNLDVAPIDVDSHDEVHTLAKAFNAMIISLRAYVAQIRDNLIRETRQKEHELVMENLLQVAQLKNLQAQINPHFLFNALNTGAQMAMLEGADRTSEFVEHVADFYRYNIKLFDRDVTLGEEIQMAKDYIYIQKVRFGDWISYNESIDPDCLSIRMPGLILQPLVENALNHGLKDVEQGGRVELIVQWKGERVEVLVHDNGRGMDLVKIRQTLDAKSLASASPSQLASETAEGQAGNGAGIALSNVVARLRLFFHCDDVIDIISGPGITGTTVKLSLPDLSDDSRPATELTEASGES